MLQIAYIRKNRDRVIERLKVRNMDAAESIDRVLDLDQQRRKAQASLDQNLAEANKINKQIGELFKAGKRDEAQELKERSTTLKTANKELEQHMNAAKQELDELLFHLPNMPHESVPAGKSDADNEILRSWGEAPDLHDGAVPHWDLTDRYNLIDFDLGSKITGSGFPVYRGRGARLQRALINFFIDEATKAGYEEIQPPLLINEASGRGTGQLPDKEGQMYHVQNDNLFLIPTAEVPITNMLRDTILTNKSFPIQMTGYTPCFRREAGAYGKDVRGLNRLHQFDKVEIVRVARPEESYAILDEMVAYVEGLLQKLELPYRVSRLCGGDLGFTSALTFDMEVYSTAQQKWLEVSSISNFETFQANRLKLRIKDANGTRLAHTLNGSALALPRIVAALLENNQGPDGITLPDALVPYTGFKTIQ